MSDPDPDLSNRRELAGCELTSNQVQALLAVVAYRSEIQADALTKDERDLRLYDVKMRLRRSAQETKSVEASEGYIVQFEPKHLPENIRREVLDDTKGPRLLRYYVRPAVYTVQYPGFKILKVEMMKETIDEALDNWRQGRSPFQPGRKQ